MGSVLRLKVIFFCLILLAFCESLREFVAWKETKFEIPLYYSNGNEDRHKSLDVCRVSCPLSVEKIFFCETTRPTAYTFSVDNCSDKFAIDHACKLLKLNKERAITLWDRHPSRVKDNATALDNIRDTCQGKAASRSKYTCKECPTPGAPGGSVCLQDVLLRYMLKLAEKLGYIHVNEIAGACHNCASLHYQGRAVDIDPTKNKSKAQAMMDICFDMQGYGINETNHIHCQFAKF